MIVLIDNYDSFSYNLVQLIGELDPAVRVVRNDAFPGDGIRTMHPSQIILSQEPGYPADAGICEDVVRRMQGEIPILGVCLGHQAICEVYGARICHAKQLMHGKQSTVSIDTSVPVFEGLPERIKVARYHSLIADTEGMPDELEITARDDAGEVMAVRHRQYEVYGLQFHPESILTPDGRKMIENFLEIKVKN